MDLTRRRLGLALGGAALAGCGERSGSARPPVTRAIRYGGDDPRQQRGELSRPTGTARGTVVLLHGGYWRSAYGLDLMRPMARDLVRRGWTVWNLEYRRVGSGGGWPATFADVAAGIDHLGRLDGVEADRPLVVGHSAGGHLAVWAASRSARTPGGAPAVRPHGVVSLAGVLDLTRGAEQGLGTGAVVDLLGGTPDRVASRYAAGDPTLLVPPGAPVRLFRGRDDDVVPLDQQTSYLSAARRAGGDVTLTQVTGDHFTIIDPRGPSWPRVRASLAALSRQPPR